MPFYIHQRGAVASTNDDAKTLAAAGAPAFTAVSATEQTEGRGRRGRVWTSPPGNLYVSLLVRPPYPASEASQLSLVAALALGDALAEYVSSSRIHNKWPNDVQVDGRKIAGLLLESSGGSQGNVEWVVIGCGVNIAFHPNLPEYDTISLNSITDEKTSIEEFLAFFLEHFEARYDIWINGGIDSIRKAWVERAANIGREIVVRLPQTEIRGVFEGLDASGALILTRAGGRRELVTAGEVFAEY